MSDLDLILNYEVEDDTTKAFDCPKCHGTGKLYVTKGQGSIRWICFRAKCNFRGRHNIRRSCNDIRRYIECDRSEEKESQGFEIPERLVPVTANDEAINFLERYNSLPAYLSRIARIMYDPKLGRVVFLKQDHHGKVVGASGRLITSSIGKPKWYNYSSDHYPFVCGKHD